jgi:hypothetical protein
MYRVLLLQGGEICCHILLIPEMGKESFFKGPMLIQFISKNQKSNSLPCPFLSFCRILSTLCSQVIFHNLPHFGKRAGQKIQRKIAVAVQNVKPIYFLSRSFALSPQKSAELFYMFL